MTRFKSIATVAAVFLASGAHAAFEIPWFTVDGGGAMRSTGGNFELSGTIGQPDAGTMAGGPFTLTGGFWVTSIVDTCGSGGTVNLADADRLAGCSSGPDSPEVASSCNCVDFDGDGDVDLEDAAGFQLSFDGE